MSPEFHHKMSSPRALHGSDWPVWINADWQRPL
jgi:hypothetical protein